MVRLDSYQSALTSFLNGDNFHQLNQYFPLIKLNRSPHENLETNSKEKIANTITETTPESKIEARKTKKIDLEDFNHVSDQYGRYERSILESLRRYLDDEPVDLLLQGSYGDRNYVKGYSDLDTVVILRDEVFEDPKVLLDLREKLIKSRYFLHRIDGLQHHGHVIMTEKLLSNYRESLLPLITWEKSGLSLSGRKSIKFNYIRDEEGMRRKFSSSTQTTKKWLQDPPRALYKQKSVLSAFMLLPTLFLQAQGQYIYKKQSFDQAQSQFDREEWKPMEKASQIRKEWPEKRIPKIGPKLFYQLHPAYPRNSSILIDRINKPKKYIDNEFAQNATNLIESMEEKINEKY